MASLGKTITVFFYVLFSDEIRNNCMTYMSSNMNKVVNTDSFARLNQDIMLEIIQGATAKLNLG